jgi:hypothetical protein
LLPNDPWQYVRAESSTHGREGEYKVLVGNPEGNRPIGLAVGRRIILKRFLEKYEGVVQAGFIWLRIWTSGGLL